MFGYHVPGPSEVLVITGKNSKSEDGNVLPARIVRGSGAFVVRSSARWSGSAWD
jgi:hypothetical protein